MTNIIRATGALPIGMVVSFAGNTIPDNMLFCDGATLDRVVFADLFAVIGTIYGSPTAATFMLPLMNDQIIRGADDSRGADLTDPVRTTGSKQLWATGAPTTPFVINALQNGTHVHTGENPTSGSHTHTTTTSVGGTNGNNPSRHQQFTSNEWFTGYSGTHTHTVRPSSTNDHGHGTPILTGGDTSTSPHTITMRAGIVVK